MELVKAGIIEEMVQDSLPEGEALEDELDDEAESEVDKILGEILDKKLVGVGSVPNGRIQNPDEVEPQEVVLEGMRERLEALKS